MINPPTISQEVDNLLERVTLGATLASTLIKQAHGVKAFQIITDAVYQGVSLVHLGDHKEPSLCTWMFVAHKDTLMMSMKELASVKGLSVADYLVELIQGDRASIIRSYELLADDELLATAMDVKIYACHGLIYAIVIHVATQIIENYNLRIHR